MVIRITLRIGTTTLKAIFYNTVNVEQNLKQFTSLLFTTP